MNQQQYPMQPMAEAIAQQGRYGDSMMVHMNPIEVEGLASLMPNGQMPINPMTGQPEAFAFLIPMLSSMFAPAAFTALGGGATTGLAGLMTTIGANSALASGIGSGLATTALTGDVKKGLASGLTSFGIGSAMGAAADATSDAAQQALQTVEAGEKGVTEATKGLIDAGAEVASLGPAPAPSLTDLTGTTETIAGGLTRLSPEQLAAQQQAALAQSKLDAARSSLDTSREALKGVRSDYTMGERLSAPFSREGASAGFKQFMSPEGFIPTAVGASYGAELEFQDAMDAEGRRLEEERAADEQASRDLMERSFEQIRQDYPEMDNQYNPYAYAQGGIVSVDPTQYAQTLQGLSDVAGPIDMNAGGVVNMVEGGPASIIYNTSPSGAGKGSVGGATGGRGSPAARNRQAKIRGTTLVAPEAGYRPGFDAEHRFFQNIAKKEDPPASTPTPVVPPEFDVPYFPEDGTPRFAADPFMNAVVGDAMSGLSPQFLGMEGLEPSEFMDLQKSAEGLGRKGVRARKKLRDLQDKQSEEIKKAAEFESEMAGITAIGREDDFKGGVALDEPVRIQRQETEVTAPAAMMDDAYLSGFNPRTVADFSNFQPRFTGSIGMQEGGITEVAAQEQMVDQPAQDDAQLGSLIEQTAMAVLGQVSEEEAEIIINRFIDEFGQEAFEMLRTQVLQGVVPNAQTEGLVDGPGGGMDDQVQGMIGDQQRVAVSPGEFIVPADVVSGLGDGDTDAGADELDAMMDRVRVERTGTLEQPPRLSAGGLLPA